MDLNKLTPDQLAGALWDTCKGIRCDWATLNARCRDAEPDLKNAGVTASRRERDRALELSTSALTLLREA